MLTPVTAGGERSSVSRPIPGLDGLRALAVLGVIASHSGVFGLGWLGVDLFFGLSGYLITRILLDSKAATQSARAFFIPFYMRRSLRILPLAWLVAIILAAITQEWSGLPWYLSYLVNWLPEGAPPRVLGHYWSLAVEEQFYLVWPAVVFFASRKTLARITVGIIATDILCRLLFSAWPPSYATHQFLGLATFARADTLLVGALLAQRERAGGWGKEARCALPVMLLSGATIVGIRALELSSAPMLLTYNLKWPVIAIAVGALLLYVLSNPPNFLSWPTLAWIGKISYGIYIIHSCFGQWLHAQFQSAAVIFILQLALTIPLAAVSWYFFESPILKQKRRWPMPYQSKGIGRL